MHSRGCGDLILHMEDPNYRWPMEGREGGVSKDRKTMSEGEWRGSS